MYSETIRAYITRLIVYCLRMTDSHTKTEPFYSASEIPAQAPLKPSEKGALWTRDFVLISLANLLLFLAFHAMNYALPVYLGGPVVNAPDNLIGLAVGVTTMSAVIFRPFVGAGVDRFGRRVFFLSGLIGMALTMALLGVIPVLLFVFIVRFLQGFAWGAANTAATTIATDVIPRARFGEGIGYFGLSGTLAMAIAPATALFLLTNLELPYYILVIGAAGLVVCSIVLSFFVRYSQGHNGAVPPPENGQPAVHEEQVNSMPKRFNFAALFEKNACVPAAIILVYNMIFGATSAFLALHASFNGVDNISWFFVIYATGMMVSRPWFGKHVDNRGYHLSIFLGLACTILSLFLIALADSLLVFMVAGVFLGVGQGAIIASLITMAVADVPFDRRGAANSTFFIGVDAGIGIGSVLSGLIAQYCGYSNLFLIMMAAPVIAGVIYLLCARKRTNPSASGTYSDGQ